MKDYASMSKIPILNKEGKIDHYEDFDYNAVLGTMGDNVGNLITGMAMAIIGGWNQFKESEPGKNPQFLSDIIEAIEPMGDFLKTLIETMISYANLRIPKYNNKGEISGYYDLVNNQEEFNKLFMQIESNITMILNGMIGGTANALSGYLKGEGKTKIEQLGDTAQTVIQILEPITGIIDMLKKYSELKFPNGQLDKDGKPTGYTSIQNMDFSNLEKTIANMISALPKAVLAAINDTSGAIEQLFGDEKEGAQSESQFDKFRSGITQIGQMMGDIYPILINFANLKIPTQFDKDGKPTKFMELNPTQFDILSTNIQSMLEAIPNAVNNVLENVVFTDDKLKELENFISMIERANYLISSLYSEGNLKELKKMSTRTNEYSANMDNIAINVNKLKKTLVENVFADMLDLMFFIDETFSNTGDMPNAKREEMVDIIDGVISQFSRMIEICSMKPTKSSTFSLFDNGETIEDKLQTMTILKTLVETVKDTATSMKDASTAILPLKEIIFTKFATIVKHVIADLSNYTGSNKMSRKKFNKLTDISESLKTIAINFGVANSNLGNVNEENFKKLGAIFDMVNTMMIETSVESVEKLEREAEAMSKYVKSINSIQVEKISTLTGLFNTIANFSQSVGDLNEFTQTLANDVSVALVDLTAQITDAKQVIKTAEKQRKKRQEELDATIKKIEKLMSKPLNVNVSSGSDTVNAAYENPKN